MDNLRDKRLRNWLSGKNICESCKDNIRDGDIVLYRFVRRDGLHLCRPSLLFMFVKSYDNYYLTFFFGRGSGKRVTLDSLCGRRRINVFWFSFKSNRHIDNLFVFDDLLLDKGFYIFLWNSIKEGRILPFVDISSDKLIFRNWWEYDNIKDVLRDLYLEYKMGA